MCGNSAGCKTFRCLIYIIVIVSCAAYLSVITTINLKYGPVSRPLDLLVPPTGVELDMTNEERPWLSFASGSHFIFLNLRNHLNITISRVEVLFLYNGLPVSCVVGENNLRLRGRSQTTLEMNATECDREGKYTQDAFPYTANMTMDAEKKRKVRMTMVMSIRARYTHRPIGWEVLLRPVCTDFVIHVINKERQQILASDSKKNMDGDEKLFLGVGTISCDIGDPLWTK
ncbi:hypothetical protein LINPERHAP2_LOCUS30782 [Linum perenne]